MYGVLRGTENPCKSKFFRYVTPRSSVAALAVRCSSLQDDCLLESLICGFLRAAGVQESRSPYVHHHTIGQNRKRYSEKLPFIAGNIQDSEGLRYQMGGVHPSFPTILILQMAWEA